MLSNAYINGQIHQQRAQNGHDYCATTYIAPQTFAGIVLDGCGSKHRVTTPYKQLIPSSNEVGAKLLGNFAHYWFAQHLKTNSDLPTLLDHFEQDCHHMLETICYMIAPQNPTQLIATNFLCTMIGFVATPTAASFFAAGDGYLCVDDQISYLDETNRPNYIGYHLLNPTAERFLQQIPIPNWPNHKRIAVATDGWNSEQLQQITKPQNNLALERWLTVEGRKRNSFTDDGAIAIWWAEENENEKENDISA